MGWDGKKTKVAVLIVSAFLILSGIAFRFYHIAENKFFYYDEGLYLDHNIDFLHFATQHPIDSFRKLIRYLEIAGHIALADAKFLWFFLASCRAFIVGVQGAYFLKVLSAVFGTLTLAVTYFFARRYYNSRWMGLLAVSLLAIFPSHVFYSRLALQEALSTLCFITGLYFYLFPRKFGFRVFLSGFFFSLVFFTNYRMIILPVLIALCEWFWSFSHKEKFNLRKYVWNVLTFLLIVFSIGAIDNGANIRITFAWMFHQADMAEGQFSWINMLSYPYYLFKLESPFLGVVFFSQIYYLIKRQWDKFFLFFLIFFMMIVFSFSLEKGVRYLCIVMPLIVISVTGVLGDFYTRKNIFWKCGIVAIAIFMVSIHFMKSLGIVQFNSDYGTSLKDLTTKNPKAKVVSSQYLVQKNYVPDRSQVVGVPHQVRFIYYLFMSGFKYLVIDPQAYITYTESGKRFAPPLRGYIGFVHENVRPHKVYPHFNDAMLERFVLEHNQNLSQSLKFLAENKSKHYGKLYVYDIQSCIVAMHQKRNVDKMLFREIKGIESMTGINPDPRGK